VYTLRAQNWICGEGTDSCLNSLQVYIHCGLWCGATSLFRVTRSCHDDASRFVMMLADKGRNYLVEEDFEPLIQVRVCVCVCVCMCVSCLCQCVCVWYIYAVCCTCVYVCVCIVCVHVCVCLHCALWFQWRHQLSSNLRPVHKGKMTYQAPCVDSLCFQFEWEVLQFMNLSYCINMSSQSRYLIGRRSCD